MIKTIDEAVAFVRSKTSIQPQVGVILGSGLGNVVDALEIETAIPYSDIPGAKASTVVGHQGRMILARVNQTPVVVMQGRIHFYEGHEMAEVMFLSRVIGRLGIKQLIVTNAAGGVNTAYKAGDLMLISDHINLMGMNPLRGPNIDDLGVRFPDMSEAYPESLRDVAQAGRARARPAAAGRRLPRALRSDVRDARRDPRVPHPRRRRRRHVDRPRGHRHVADADPGARHLLHHQHGRRNPEAETDASGSDGHDRARAERSSPRWCWDVCSDSRVRAKRYDVCRVSGAKAAGGGSDGSRWSERRSDHR